MPTMDDDDEDELDRLFDFDANAASKSAPINRPDGPSLPAQTEASVQDIDEEVKVTKRRRAVTKLDEPRLRSVNGVPKLQRAVKALNFKGKGHEFSDMVQVLNTYQFWLDELYPKAKFADGLAMIEALGHKKTLQGARLDWIKSYRLQAVETETEEDQAEDEQRKSQNTGETGDEYLDCDRPREVTPDNDELEELLAIGTRGGSGSSFDRTRVAAESPQGDIYADAEEAMADVGW